QTRAALHARIGAWLEEDGSVDPAERDERAGYHLEQAALLTGELEPQAAVLPELRARAGSRLAAAGKRAQGRGDLTAAGALLTRSANSGGTTTRPGLRRRG